MVVKSTRSENDYHENKPKCSFCLLLSARLKDWNIYFVILIEYFFCLSISNRMGQTWITHFYPFMIFCSLLFLFSTFCFPYIFLIISNSCSYLCMLASLFCVYLYFRREQFSILTSEASFKCFCLSFCL